MFAPSINKHQVSKLIWYLQIYIYTPSTKILNINFHPEQDSELEDDLNAEHDNEDTCPKHKSKAYNLYIACQWLILVHRLVVKFRYYHTMTQTISLACKTSYSIRILRPLTRPTPHPHLAWPKLPGKCACHDYIWPAFQVSFMVTENGSPGSFIKCKWPNYVFAMSWRQSI